MMPNIACPMNVRWCTVALSVRTGSSVGAQRLVTAAIRLETSVCSSAGLVRNDCTETGAVTLDVSNILSVYGPSNYTCARGNADAETNASILSVTISPDLLPYQDTTTLQVILFNANGQTDYWDGSGSDAIGDFFVLEPSVDTSDAFAVPSQRIDFTDWGSTDQMVRANLLDENDVLQNPIHSYAAEVRSAWP